MNEKFIKITLATIYIALSIVLMGSLIDLYDGLKIYTWIVPLLLTVAGLSMLSDGPVQQRQNFGVSLIIIGVIAMLVRLNLIRGDVVNALLSVILLIVGVAALTGIRQGSSDHSTKKSEL